MIEFIMGLPRQGKTLYSVHLILEHLKNYMLGNETRPLVTNVSLFISDVVYYLHENFEGKFSIPEIMDKVEECVEILDDEGLSEFYRHRGKNLYLQADWDVERKGHRSKQPDYSRQQGGVVYFLDELHIVFVAGSRTKSGDLALFYLSQHGKFNDHVVCITQVPDFVDKSFRSMAQLFHVIKNNYQRRFWGVKMKGCFKRESFASLPKVHSVPMEKDSFTLDMRVAKCYDTSAGVGVGGGRPPEQTKNKGLPWWVVPIGGLAVIALFITLLFGSQSLISNYFTGVVDPTYGKETVAKATGKKEGSTIIAENQTTHGKPVKIDLDKGIILFDDKTECIIKGSAYSVSIVKDLAMVNGEPVEYKREIFKTANPFLNSN